MDGQQSTVQPTTSVPVEKKDNTLKYILIGIGVLILCAALSCAAFFAIGAFSVKSAVDTVKNSVDDEKKKILDGNEKAGIKAIGGTHQIDKLKITLLEASLFNDFDEYYDPSAGNQYVAVLLEFENTGSEAQTAGSTLFATMTSATSSEKFSEAYLVDKEPVLQSKELKPGEKLKGYVIYQVSQKASKLKFEYKDITIFGADHLRYWEFSNPTK